MTRSLSANFAAASLVGRAPPPREEMIRLTEIANAFVSELLSREPWWFVYDDNTTVKTYERNQ